MPQATRKCAERRDAVQASAIRIDHKFKLGYRFQIDRVVFDLQRGAIWAERPLLAHDLTVCLFCGRGAQQKLLGALDLMFDKMQYDPSNTLRRIEKYVMVCAPGPLARQPSSLSVGFVLSAFSIGNAGSSDVSCTRAIEFRSSHSHRWPLRPPFFAPRFPSASATSLLQD